MPPSPSYARVIIPLAVEGAYTYSIPDHLSGKIRPGLMVLVPFGKRRIYTGVIREAAEAHELDVTPKEILELLDDQPMVLPAQLQLWDWMSSYYMCQPGEIMRAALPSGLRPESESRVSVSPGYDDDGSMDPQERLLFEVIRDQGEVSMGDLQLTGISRSPLGILKKLVERGAVELNERIRSLIPRKEVEYIRPGAEYAAGDAMVAVLDGLGRAPRQRVLLERYLQQAGTDTGKHAEVPRKSLLRDEGDAGALSSLIRKGILETYTREELIRKQPLKLRDPHRLNAEQAAALASIREQFGDHQTVLLHGITSSGKTEIYIHLIREYLEIGKQVLYLLPEIALTAQIISRLKEVFGDRVGVFHSRSGDADRVHVYRNLMGLTDEEPYRVVIGVRSALFLPLREAGLVFIDEEHENTFKQHDPAPRYHARDSAQVLALFQGARVLMGTATPSFESLHNARSGKFGYVTLNSRFGAVEKPELILADVRLATKRKQMRSHFTPQLMAGIRETLDRGEQVILFQNRRGFSQYLVCNECMEIPRCRRCDVSLTFHRSTRKMECHYCGYSEPVPMACPACGHGSMSMKGFGTEKLEDELPLFFEGIRVVRLDTDTARSQRAYEKVLSDFASGRADVLVGTQMISKGLDFGNVSLVGVLDADSMMHFPDFRAFERSFQLISQVSGRAGRRARQGKVIIQTSDPDHPVIRAILRDDFEGLYRDQMEERRMFSYPPFTRIIRLSFRHKIPSILDGATSLVAKELREVLSSRVLGPQYPPVRKVHDTFIKHILLKIEREASHEKARKIIQGILEKELDSDVYRQIRVSVDVDPY